MAVYLIEYSDYLKNLQVSDFPDIDALNAHMLKKEPDWPRFMDDPATSAIAVENDCDLSTGHMSGPMRRDLYNLLLPEGTDLVAGRLISPSELMLRIELFMRE